MLRQTFVKKFCLQRTTTYTRAQNCWHTYSRNFEALSTNWQKNFLKIMSLSVTQNYSSTPIFTSNRLCSIRRPFLAADDSTTIAVILPSLNMNPMWPVESLWSVKVLSNGLKKDQKVWNREYFNKLCKTFFWWCILQEMAFGLALMLFSCMLVLPWNTFQGCICNQLKYRLLSINIPISNCQNNVVNSSLFENIVDLVSSITSHIFVVDLQNLVSEFHASHSSWTSLSHQGNKYAFVNSFDFDTDFPCSIFT